MDKRILTWAERKRLRDEAIVDFRHGFINRREFMRRSVAVGVSAAFAVKVAECTGRAGAIDQAQPVVTAGRCHDHHHQGSTSPR